QILTKKGERGGQAPFLVVWLSGRGANPVAFAAWPRSGRFSGYKATSADERGVVASRRTGPVIAANSRADAPPTSTRPAQHGPGDAGRARRAGGGNDRCGRDSEPMNKGPRHTLDRAPAEPADFCSAAPDREAEFAALLAEHQSRLFGFLHALL